MYYNMEKKTMKTENSCHMKWLVALMKLVELIINLVKEKKKSEPKKESENQ